MFSNVSRVLTLTTQGTMLWDTFDPTAAPTFLPRPPVPLAGAPQAAHGLREAWRSAAASFGSAVRCHAALSGASGSQAGGPHYAAATAAAGGRVNGWVALHCGRVVVDFVEQGL